MKPRKLNKGFRLSPELVTRMKACADWMQANETDVVEEALNEYLARFERSLKRQREGNPQS